MGRSPCPTSKQGQTRGAYWTALEDKILKDYIEINGAGMWDKIPEQTGLKRGGKSCRLRWMNYLRPDIIRGSITLDEEDLIIKLHKLLGNRWSVIARRLPGRTDNEIKNYWKTVLSKRVLQANCGHPTESTNSEDLFNEPFNIIDNHNIDPSPSLMEENVGGKRLRQPSFDDEVLENNNRESDWGFSIDDSSWDLMMDLNERQIISQSEILPNDDSDKLYDRYGIMIENEDGYIGYRNWSSPSSIESLSLINWIGVDSFQIESDLDLW